MFSNSKNIETISELVSALKRYLTLQGEYVRLDVVDKSVKVLTAITLVVCVGVLALIAMVFTGIAAAFLLEPLTSRAGAFAIVAGVFVLLLLLLVAFRKRLVVRPLVRFLSSLLLQQQ